MKKFYITTPIYYINDIPHIGHAYTTVAADVLARHHRKKGDEVFFLTGTDEHGAKIEEAASKAGKTPKEFVDNLVPKFKEAWKKLNISYDEYIRTSDPEHEAIVSEIVAKLKDKGYVEKRSYEGLYCVGCERYYKTSELVDGLCPDHKIAPIKQSEENYFFLLSKFEDKLIEIIESGELQVGPDSRRNEVLGKLRQGLEDVSISREAVKWGISFPGDDTQTVYVWIDALLNYFSATKIFKKESFWPADVHLIGKDILWFHAIIWPAVLLALDIPIPKTVFANGYFTIDGHKMSKSLGNVIDPVKMVEKYGADATRYAVLRAFPFGEDGDISENKIAELYQKDLGNELGNLLQRTLSMINKYEVRIDRRDNYLILDEESFSTIEAETSIQYSEGLKEFKFDQVLSSVWRLVRANNSFIDEKKPWSLAKEENHVELTRVLNVCYWQLEKIADLLEIFMPETSDKMKKQLEEKKPEVLFPRIEE